MDENNAYLKLTHVQLNWNFTVADLFSDREINR